MSNGPDRNLGVTMITAFFAFGALSLAILALVVVAGAQVLGDLPVVGLGVLAYGFALLLVLLAGVHAAVGYGIWTMTEWGWAAGLVTSGIYAFGHLFGAVSGFGLSLGSLVIVAAIAWYLYRERARFREPTSGRASAGV